jgi:hypothetical protein
MKSVLASAILMATSAQACIRVKAFMWSSGTFHDVMSVEVWDNNDFKVVLWDNGGDGTIEHKVSGEF